MEEEAESDREPQGVDVAPQMTSAVQYKKIGGLDRTWRGVLWLLQAAGDISRGTQENGKIDVSGDIRPRTTLKLCLHPYNC